MHNFKDENDPFVKEVQEIIVNDVKKAYEMEYEARCIIVDHILKTYLCVQENVITREVLSKYGISGVVESVDCDFYGVLLTNGICVFNNGTRAYVLDRLLTKTNHIGDLRCEDAMYYIKNNNQDESLV